MIGSLALPCKSHVFSCTKRTFGFLSLFYDRQTTRRNSRRNHFLLFLLLTELIVFSFFPYRFACQICGSPPSLRGLLNQPLRNSDVLLCINARLCAPYLDATPDWWCLFIPGGKLIPDG